MTKLYAFALVPLVLTLTAATAWGQTSGGPETVVVHSGSATLHAMLWRPQGREPFPAILLNHGSGRTGEDLERLGPYEQNAEKTRSGLRSPWLRIPILIPTRRRAFRGPGR
jgi:poly(3-hydroxybutyrate) depolymerase